MEELLGGAETRLDDKTTRCWADVMEWIARNERDPEVGTRQNKASDVLGLGNGDAFPRGK